MSDTKPRIGITDSVFSVENITIDQRFVFEKRVKELETRIVELEAAITDALEKLEKPYNEDDRIYPAMGILETVLAKKGTP